MILKILSRLIYGFLVVVDVFFLYVTHGLERPTEYAIQLRSQAILLGILLLIVGVLWIALVLLERRRIKRKAPTADHSIR